MSQRRRPLPADMLLLAARRDRFAAPPVNQESNEEILTSDDDELVESATSGAAAPKAGGGVLRRPIEDVHLGHIGWSAPIDHIALQAALACEPIGLGQTAMDSADPTNGVGQIHLRMPDVRARIYSRARDREESPITAPGNSVALEATLSTADLALFAQLGALGSEETHDQVLRALLLPERIVGATLPTQQALSGVLAAYRRSSLEHAWQVRLGIPNQEELARERDEAAVALLSTLRAILGER